MELFSVTINIHQTLLPLYKHQKLSDYVSHLEYCILLYVHKQHDLVLKVSNTLHVYNPFTTAE